MNLRDKGGVYNSIMVPSCSGGPLNEAKPEGEAIDSILHSSLNGSHMDPGPYKVQKTDKPMQPSVIDAKKGGPMDFMNPLKMNRNVKKVSLPIQQESMKADAAKEKKTSSGIGAFGKPPPSNLLQAKRSMPARPFRQSQITTKRVKCADYNNQNAVKSALSIPKTSRPSCTTNSILQEDSSQALKHKGSVMNRLKNRATMKNTQPSTDDVSH